MAWQTQQWPQNTLAQNLDQGDFNNFNVQLAPKGSGDQQRNLLRFLNFSKVSIVDMELNRTIQSKIQLQGVPVGQP